MGPIRGIGYGLSANDFKALIQSLKNFGIMVAASVLASYLFYLITPIKSETSELLSRTKPHVLDILIAFFRWSSWGYSNNSKKQSHNNNSNSWGRNCYCFDASLMYSWICNGSWKLAIFYWCFLLVFIKQCFYMSIDIYCFETIEFFQRLNLLILKLKRK